MTSEATNRVRLSSRTATPARTTAATVRTRVMTLAAVPRRSMAGSAITSGAAASADVAIAGHYVLCRGQLRESHGPPCMQFLGGDPDLRAEAELSPVREPRGGVHKHDGGVDLRGEPASGCL